MTFLAVQMSAQNLTGKASAKTEESEEAGIFLPISKYIERGNADCLAAWFSDNLRLDILGRISHCSRTQAIQILRAFFQHNKPRSFEFEYKSGEYPMEYAIGHLDSGGSIYAVTVVVNSDSTGNYIQHLKISRE